MDNQEYSFDGTSPGVHKAAHVSEAATLVGDVTDGYDDLFR